MAATTTPSAWALALALAVVAMAPARAQPVIEDGDHRAYRAALQCLTADAYLSGWLRQRGQDAKAVPYEAAGKRAFDAAMAMGRKLGRSNGELNADLDQLKATEMPKLVKDDAYLKATVAECRALGLM
jgi:hypothetical protein